MEGDVKFPNGLTILYSFSMEHVGISAGSKSTLMELQILINVVSYAMRGLG